MQSEHPAGSSVPFVIPLIAGMVMGLAFAIFIGLIFSDESWTRFIGPGVIFGLSSTASIRKRHVPSLLISIGGLTWLLQILVWDSESWLLSLGWVLSVAIGLGLWVLLGMHRRSGSSAG